jgi:hypothetical protein
LKVSAKQEDESSSHPPRLRLSDFHFMAPWKMHSEDSFGTGWEAEIENVWRALTLQQRVLHKQLIEFQAKVEKCVDNKESL